MNQYIIVGGAIGLLLFIPLCIKILKKESMQNPLTYFLWTVLDSIYAGSTYLEKGNYLLALLFASSGLITVGCILYARGIIKWTKFETLVTLMAIFCIEVWVFNSNTLAATASMCAVMIAGIPQIVDTWNNPKGTPTLIYSGYILSSWLSAVGGKEFSVIEAGYPFASLVISTFVTVFSLRKT